MLDADIGTARRALVNIVGGENLTLREAETVFQEISGRISKDGMLKWGARIDPEMPKDSIRVMLVVSGVEFPEYTEDGIKKSMMQLGDMEIDELFEDKIA
jgi:cell division protein FtsZ